MDCECPWNDAVTKTLDSGHTLKLFKSIYASNNTFGYLKQYLVAVLSLIDPFQPLTFEHLSEVYTSQVNKIIFFFPLSSFLVSV